jgi:hypothetical protein
MRVIHRHKLTHPGLCDTRMEILFSFSSPLDDIYCSFLLISLLLHSTSFFETSMLTDDRGPRQIQIN